MILKNKSENAALKNGKEIVKKFLSDLFNQSNILDYKCVDIDDDINYLVTPKLTNKKIKDNFKLSLLVYCSNAKSLTIYCPRVYKLKNEDSAMYTLNAINETNSKIALGKIYLNKENNSVISYINRVIFNNITTDLTPKMMNEFIDSFLYSCIEFYNQMKKDINDE